MPKVTAIVPVKSFSTRVENKNFRICGGVPLYLWIFNSLQRIPEIDDIVIYTDRPELLSRLSESPRVLMMKRDIEPHHHPILPVLEEVHESVPSDWYLLTHCTNPLLKSQTIRNVIQSAFINDFDSYFTVQPEQKFFWVNGKPNYSKEAIPLTQDLPVLYKETSSLYLYKNDVIRSGRRIGDNPSFVEIGLIEGWDIDTEEEFVVADCLLRSGYLPF